MKIEEMIKRLEEYAEEAKAAFGGLSKDRFNWKANPESWSVGQCLDHLVVTNRKEIPAIEGAAQGNFNKSIWERIPGLSSLTGKLVMKAVDPDNVKKSKAPKVFLPSQSEIDTVVVEDYVETSGRLRELLKQFSDGEIEKMVITSPVSKIATYCLYDAFRIVVLHDRRHLNQAKRVMEMKGFPK